MKKNPDSYGPKFISHSLSGGERNQLFLQSADNFKNISLVSGVDDKADARSFAILDYDNDGWLDIATASPNAPRSKLYRNQLASITKSKSSVVAIKLIGANSSDSPSTNFSSRDPYGAVITVSTSQRTRVFNHQASQGLSAQNSAITRIAIVPGETVNSITVKWPSGLINKIIPTSPHITIKESP